MLHLVHLDFLEAELLEECFLFLQLEWHNHLHLNRRYLLDLIHLHRDQIFHHLLMLLLKKLKHHLDFLDFLVQKILLILQHLP